MALSWDSLPLEARRMLNNESHALATQHWQHANNPELPEESREYHREAALYFRPTWGIA